MNQEEKTEGIVLRAFDYKERERILNIFTYEAGVISLILKNLSKKNYRLLALSTPFSQAEIIFTRGKSDLFRYIDGTILDEHPRLREQYAFLTTAGKLVQAILHSQLPGKPTPTLYLLFRSFLKQIPSFENPFSLLASFQLKLLRHEGLLSLSSQCAHCGKTPTHFLWRGESVCSLHANPGSLSFNEEEWKVLNLLENTHHFSTLRSLFLPAHFPDMITSYFYDRLHHD